MGNILHRLSDNNSSTDQQKNSTMRRLIKKFYQVNRKSDCYWKIRGMHQKFHSKKEKFFLSGNIIEISATIKILPRRKSRNKETCSCIIFLCFVVFHSEGHDRQLWRWFRIFATSK